MTTEYIKLPLPSTVDLGLPIYIIDLQTKEVIRETSYKNRKRARSYAEKLNLEYGAHRYSATMTKPN